MEDWQKNGLVKWDNWQYLFMSDVVKFQTNALSDSMAKHRELVCREYLKNTDRLIASQETVYEIIEGIVNRVSSQSQQRDTSPTVIVNDNNLILSKTFKNGVNEVLGSLSFLNENLGSHLEEIVGAINNLDASYNWGVDRVVWHLSDIKKAIQMPIDNKALNYRMRAINAYQNGWFDEALKEFTQAEFYYEYDFITQQYLGDLYLYHKKDLDKALEHFSRAAKYSMIRNAPEENRKVSSWAELHIGLVYYKKNNFEEAAKAAYRAAVKNPSPEAMYQIGHYLSLTKQRDERLADILRTFEQAIRKDPVYFLKIDMDHNLFEKDLFVVKHEMKALKEALFKEEKDKVEKQLAQVRREYESYRWHFDTKTRTILFDIEWDIRKAEEMFKNRKSYIDFRIVQAMLYPPSTVL